MLAAILCHSHGMFFNTTVCFSGVVNLKCPSDPGWWYWKGNCYYIETVTLLTWDKARDFCSNYHGTKLLSTPSSLEEQVACSSLCGIGKLFYKFGERCYF